MKRIFQEILFFIVIFMGVYYVGARIYNAFNSKHLNLPIGTLQVEQCQKLHPSSDIETVRILVVSGGGVDGIIPLTYLKYFEEHAKRPASELFDLFVGTSTGSIIVSALNIPDASGHSYISVVQLLEDYKKDVKKTMNSTVWRKIFTLNGLLGPRFSTQKLYENYQKKQGIAQPFYRLLNHVAVTNYHMEKLSMSILENWDCNKERVYSPIADILVSNTAAPMFYAPVIFNKKNQTAQTYIDGGLMSNNPSLQAISLATKQFPKMKKIILVHLDTGRFALKESVLLQDDSRSWGELYWIVPLAKIWSESQRYEVHQGLNDLLKFVSPDKFQYFYLNANVPSDSFNVSDEHFKYLESASGDAVKAQQKKLDKLLDMLVTKN